MDCIPTHHLLFDFEVISGSESAATNGTVIRYLDTRSLVNEMPHAFFKKSCTLVDWLQFCTHDELSCAGRAAELAGAVGGGERERLYFPGAP